MSRLTEAARAGSFDAIGDIWLEELDRGIPVDEMIEVVRCLTGADRAGLARELIEFAIDVMDDGTNSDLPVFLRNTAGLFDVFEPFRRSLVESLRDEHLMFQPLETFLRKSGLSVPGSSVSEGWENFTRLMMYDRGGMVYHPTFGPGEVLRISRSFITIDFQKAQEHEMDLEVALETTIPLEKDSLVVMAWKDPEYLRGLAGSDPGKLLGLLLAEPFGTPGELCRQDLAPFLDCIGMASADLWKTLRRAAVQTAGISDLGDRIVLRGDALTPAGQIVQILEHRTMSVSDKTREIQSLLHSVKKMDSETRNGLLDRLFSLKSPETGALFEMAWILSGSRKKLPDEAMARFVESTAARAGRALAEIHSLSCRKLYLEAFLSGGADSGEKLMLLSGLKRSMWEHGAAFLEKTAPDLLNENIGRFLSDPSETDRFLWALIYCAECDSQPGAPSGTEHLELLLRNLIFAKADTQKRVIVLLLGGLKEELDAYLAASDTRSLLNLLDSLDDCLAAHREGLFLAVNRELARRKESSPVERTLKRFWETDLLFSSRDAISRRGEEILQLRQVDIPAAADAIGVAASHGDLSENAEYAAAMERRDLLLDRLRRWDEEMERFRPYPATEISTSLCSPGTRVRLAIPDLPDVPGKTFDVVGPLDADPGSGRINYLAPIGAILLGRSTGDRIELPGENGRDWEIISIEILEEVSGP